ANPVSETSPIPTRTSAWGGVIPAASPTPAITQTPIPTLATTLTAVAANPNLLVTPQPPQVTVTPRLPDATSEVSAQGQPGAEQAPVPAGLLLCGGVLLILGGLLLLAALRRSRQADTP
ncbi:MAG: hypothetical protein WHV44_07510, partial [Anaerolineales bacterium]